MHKTSIHDIEEVERHFSSHRLDPGLVRRLRNGFYKKHEPASRALERLPAEPREHVAQGIEFHALELDQVVPSRLDGATKLIFRNRAGLLLESVILRVHSGRTALCVSSQVGCAAHCSFCATGQMGIARDLDGSEILDQLVQANDLLRDEERHVRNVVFMGMGEPLHNEANLHHALRVLTDTRCFDHPQRYILVSTVGVPDAMVRLAETFPRVNLALSLHSARETTRRSIIPLARRHDLDSLREALRRVTRVQGQRVMIEYLMLDGINDTDREREALVRYLEGLPVLINLIPFNPIDDAPHLAGTPREQREAFGAALRSAGFDVTLRYSLGSDIAAACGQLVRRENRRIARGGEGALRPRRPCAGGDGSV